MNNFKSLTQERAAFAMKAISDVKEDNQKKKKFATIAKKLPALIVNNGLIPTLAFLKSKAEYQLVFNKVEEWLRKEENKAVHKIMSKYEEEDLIEVLASMPSNELLLVTSEALAFADWLKRLSEAYLSEDEGHGEES